MVTTVSYEEIDRLFYERLRITAVAAGLTVDVSLHSNKESYQAARNTLRATLEAQNSQLVDILGVGAWDDRDETSDARIVVNRLGEAAGAIGGSPVTYYEPYLDINGDSKFKKLKYPDMSENIDYEVRLITNNINLERVLSTLITNAIGKRRHLPTADANGNFTSNYVMVVANGSYNLSDKNFIERANRYRVEDVFIQSPELVRTNISPVSTVVFDMDLNGDGNTDISLTFDVISPFNRVTQDGLMRLTESGTPRNLG